jgi:GNAT superfamily N-acetyltransferase
LYPTIGNVSLRPLRTFDAISYRAEMLATIRIAAAADVPAMHRIRQCVRENRLSDPQRITEASYLPYVAVGTAWVAETDLGIAGFAILDREAKSVWALFVDPKAEGVGVGRALHDQLLELAREKGIRQLSLSTSQETRAERFYTRSGWIQVGFTASGEVRFEKTLVH